jgi:FkbM family methyltransferase
VVAKELYWGKGKRPRPQDQCALDVFAALARDATLVLDIGAYTGVFSLLAARVSSEAEVHAFEIVPEAAKAATDNVLANDLLTRITVHTEGVGRDGEVVKVAVGKGGSALPDYYSVQLHFDKGVHVRLRALDSILASIPKRVSRGSTVMKIDVEGTEDVVLQHGQAALKTCHPDILCELLTGVSNTEAVHAALAPHGYRYFIIEEHHLREQIELTPNERYRDWLFTTRTDAELIKHGIPLARGAR